MSDVNNISNKKLGRRPGNSDARKDILIAAQNLFALYGYDRTSMRKVAAAAAVDPALVVHYFKTKQQLFIESMLPLFELPKQLPNMLQGDRETIGLRLAQLFVGMTSEPSVRTLMLGMFKSVSSEEAAAKMLHTFVQGAIIEQVEPFLPGQQKKLRANLLGSQLVGLFITRYIIKLEPIASASDDVLIGELADRLQSFFD